MQQLKTAIRTTDLQSSWVLHLFVYAYVTFVFAVGPFRRIKADVPSNRLGNYAIINSFSFVVTSVAAFSRAFI